MPPGTVSALVNELTSGSTVNGLRSAHVGGHPATSFANVVCEEGFKCVSNVELFGLNHDGVYKGLPMGVELPPQYKGAYEWGCPARGKMSAAGACEETDDKDASRLCWSNSRFEAGKNA